MRFWRVMAAVAVIVVMGAVVRGEGPAATTRAGEDVHWGVVARYVDDQTLVVGHLDVGKVDLPAVEKFVNEVLDAGKVAAEERQGLPAMWTMAAGYKLRFEKLGGRQVYLLMAHPDAWPGMEPVAVLLPLEKGGDAQGMMDFLKGTLGNEMTVSKLGEELVYVGQALPLKRFGTMKAVKRADIEAGLAGSGGGALQVVMAPTADVRRAVAELLPRLPAEVAGDPLDASTEFLTKGLKAAMVKVEMPPGGTVTLSFWSGSEEDAGKISGLLGRVLDLVKTNKEFAEQAPKEIKDLVGMLKPVTITITSGGSKTSMTSLTLDEKAVEQVAGVLLPAVERARALAESARSQSNLHQILIACYSYAQEHKDEWPATLDALVDAKIIPTAVLVNPADKKHRQYVYHPWTKEEMKKVASAQWPVIWEVVDDENAGLNVGFMDGHSQFYLHQKDFKEVLRKAEAEAGRK